MTLFAIAVLSLAIDEAALAQTIQWERSFKADNAMAMSVDCADSLDCMLMVHTTWYQELHYSQDGGGTWKRVYFDSIEYVDTVDYELVRMYLKLHKIQHPTRELTVVAADSGTIIRSTDAGVTWSRVKVAAPHNWGYALSMRDDRYGIVQMAGVGVPLFVTDDGGASWRQVSLPFPAHWSTVPRLAPTVLSSGGGSFMAIVPGGEFTPGYGSVMALLRSSDAGETWDLVHPMLEGRDQQLLVHSEFAPADDGTIYVLSHKPERVFNTLISRVIPDQRQLRVVYEPEHPQPRQFSAISFRDSLNGMACGLMGVHRTTDGGITWNTLDSTPYFDGKTPNQVYVERGNRGLLVSRLAGEVMRPTARLLPSGVTSEQSTGDISVARVGERVRVRMSLRSPAVVRVSLHDLLGRELLVLPSQQAPGGAYERLIDLSPLPSGSYLLRVEAGDQLAIEKISRVR